MRKAEEVALAHLVQPELGGLLLVGMAGWTAGAPPLRAAKLPDLLGQAARDALRLRVRAASNPIATTGQALMAAREPTRLTLQPLVSSS